MKIAYIEKGFRPKTLALIENANRIIAEYQADGYDLTLRQLYYQFVARDLIPNTVRSYNRLGSAVNDGRLAGLIDWTAIEDRTRNLVRWRDDSSVEEGLADLAAAFSLDYWKDQPYRVEVWVEKEALAGIFERICSRFGIPYFACRGYVSQSEMWAAAQRLRRYARNGQRPVLLHFGDHDPSGIDMTRDIVDRLDLFGVRAQVDRLALNMDQVEQYGPPPNPAKTTDSRFQAYVRRYGGESWELDALDPRTLDGIVSAAVDEVVDREAWDAVVEAESEGRKLLSAASEKWDDLRPLLNGRGQ